MTLDPETEMTREEIGAFLERQETGVLALAREDEPYAVPVSFGYDTDDGRLFLRLVFSQNSDKQSFLSASSKACLVVYEEGEKIYRSVVAIGTPEKLPADARTSEHDMVYGEIKRPLFELWGTFRPEADIPPPDLEIQLYELDPDELTGHQIELDR